MLKGNVKLYTAVPCRDEMVKGMYWLPIYMYFVFSTVDTLNMAKLAVYTWSVGRCRIYFIYTWYICLWSLFLLLVKDLSALSTSSVIFCGNWPIDGDILIQRRLIFLFFLIWSSRVICMEVIIRCARAGILLSFNLAKNILSDLLPMKPFLSNYYLL